MGYPISSYYVLDISGLDETTQSEIQGEPYDDIYMIDTLQRAGLLPNGCAITAKFDPRILHAEEELPRELIRKIYPSIGIDGPLDGLYFFGGPVFGVGQQTFSAIEAKTFLIAEKLGFTLQEYFTPQPHFCIGHTIDRQLDLIEYLSLGFMLMD